MHVIHNSIVDTIRNYPRFARGTLAPTKFQLLFAAAAFLPLIASTSNADDAELLARAANGTTVAIVRVDSSKVDLPPQLNELVEQDSTGTFAELVQLTSPPIEQIRTLLRGETGYFAFDLPYGPLGRARLLTSANVPESRLKALAEVIWPMAVGPTERAAGWRTIQLGMGDDAFASEPLDPKLIPTEAESWQDALEETSDFPVQIGVIYPKYFRDTFAEIDPELPPMLGGGSSKVLVSGIDWLSVGFQPADATIRVVIQTNSADTAEAVKSQIPKMFRGLLAEARLDEASTAMAMAIIGLLQPKTNGSQVILSLEDPQQSQTLLQIASATIAATAKPMAISQTQNNFKQLVLGMHNHASAFKALPTYYNMEESSGLSWRVHILPFMDEVELYDEFKLDESWDSPHNIRLLERMPQVFKPVIPMGSKESVKPFHTCYVAPIGEKTVFGQDKVVRFSDITDGSSNTIAFVELQPEDAIPWTSPEEYRYDPDAPAAELRSVNGRVSAAFMDGSVRGIRDDEPASTWNALFSRNGGEIFQLR